MHPIYNTLLRRPDLLAAHISNYAALAKEEATAAVRGVATRAVAGATAGVSILLALGLTGVAVMLGAVHGEFVWAMVIVPGIAWLIAAIGLFLVLRPAQTEIVQDLKKQVEADVAALRVAGETN